jgi:hypothetical protein
MRFLVSSLGIALALSLPCASQPNVLLIAFAARAEAQSGVGSCEPFRGRFEKIHIGDGWTNVVATFGSATTSTDSDDGVTTATYALAGCTLTFRAGAEGKLLEKQAKPPLAKAQSIVPQGGRNPAKAADSSGQEEKFNNIIQGFFPALGKTEADASVCNRVLADLRPIAQAGYVPAQWALASLYLDRTLSYGGRRATCPSVTSEKEGIVWLRRVADQGVWAARIRLAQAYATAEASTLNLAEAYALYDVTKQETERHCLSKLMSVEDIERAQTLSTTYAKVSDLRLDAGVSLGSRSITARMNTARSYSLERTLGPTRRGSTLNSRL